MATGKLRLMAEREVPEMPEENDSIQMAPSFDSTQLEERLEKKLSMMIERMLGKIEGQNSAVLNVAFNIGKVVTERFMQLLLPFLVTLGAFTLWYSILTHPDVLQLIGLGLYGGFIVLPVLWTFRRK